MSSKIRPVLALAVLSLATPLRVRAQPAPELLPSRTEEAPAALRSTPSAAEGRPSRVAVELLAGGASAAALTLGGSFTGWAVDSRLGTCNAEFCGLLGALLGGAVGYTAGAAVGVWGGGYLMGGRGKLTPTVVGTLVGAGVGLATYFSIPKTEPSAYLAAGALMGMPIVGGIIGYEWSHGDVLAAEAPRAAGAPTVHPYLASGKNGAIAGIYGSF